MTKTDGSDAWREYLERHGIPYRVAGPAVGISHSSAQKLATGADRPQMLVTILRIQKWAGIDPRAWLTRQECKAVDAQERHK